MADSIMKGSRPWQATSLGVLDIIAAVFAFLGAVLFFVMRDFVTSLFSSGGGAELGLTGSEVDAAAAGADLFASLGMGVAIILLAFGVLYIFMARGAFKGQKWSPIVSIIFGILGLLMWIMSVVGGGFEASMIVSLAVNAFVVYAGFVCVKNSYFQK